MVEDVVRLVIIETHESENEGAELRLSDHRVNRTTELLTDDNEQVVRTIEILSFTNKERAANSCIKYFIFWLLELSLDLLIELLQILIDYLDLLLMNLVRLSLKRIIDAFSRLGSGGLLFSKTWLATTEADGSQRALLPADIGGVDRWASQRFRDLELLPRSLHHADRHDIWLVVRLWLLGRRQSLDWRRVNNSEVLVTKFRQLTEILEFLRETHLGDLHGAESVVVSFSIFAELLGGLPHKLRLAVRASRVSIASKGHLKFQLAIIWRQAI